MAHRRKESKVPRAVCTVAVLTLLLGADLAWAEGAPGSCVEACERHITERSLRARICGRCLLMTDARAGWVRELLEVKPFPEAVVERALQDRDWQVSREAARVLASRRGQSLEAFFARWLADAQGTPADRACMTAARTAAAEGMTLSAWQKRLSNAGGADGRRAFSALARCESKLRAQLEVEIYDIERRTQLEALRHLSALTGRTPAATVLEAMRARPVATDRIAAGALLLDAEHGGEPVGLALLKATTPETQERANRLVTVYAEDVAKLAERRNQGDGLARRGVVNDLKLYAPISAPELEAMLADEELTVRLGAARALAAGEGRDLEAAVRARVRPKPPQKPAPADVQARWLKLYGSSGARNCGRGVVHEVAADELAPDLVRGAALEALAACGGAHIQPTVTRALRSTSPVVRASAVAALESMPPSSDAKQAASRALKDPSPEVKAAAARVVAVQRQSQVAQELAGLMQDGDARVRAAAVRGLATLGAQSHVQAVAERLKSDADREVRIAAVEALGQFGGAVAVGALSHAATNDDESRVRYLADQRLKALGFRR